MGVLFKMQMKSLLSSLFRNRRSAEKKRSKGFIVLMAILFLYLGLAFAALSCMLCFGLLGLCKIGYNWMYFAFIGIINLAFGVLMNVFLTQDTLYNAKDNELLLSMPIKPGNILFVRMLSLVSSNILISLIIMVPAGIIYAVNIGFTIAGLILFALGFVAFPLIIQAISCVFGWLLNKLYSKLSNKAVVSFIFMIAFLAIYFYVYPKLMEFMDIGTQLGKQMSGGVIKWGWPLYAFGMGCAGNILYALAFIAISFGLFALVYYIIRANYLKSLINVKSSHKRKNKSGEVKVKTPIKSICFKELRLFVTSPVYLTNMGLGVLLIPVFAVAGIIFKSDIMTFLTQFGIGVSAVCPLIVCFMGFLLSMALVSAPSISLEGKSLWIMKSLPVSGKDVVKGKLLLHCIMLIPLTAVCSFVLSVVYGADILSVILCTVCSAVFPLLTGILGLIFNLLFPRFDWVNEAGPCKQSVALMLSMFVSFAFTILMGALFVVFLLFSDMLLCILAVTALLIVSSSALYFLLIKWGAKRFEMIQG